MGNSDCVNTGRGRRILLVEDHADTALVMSRLLERMGFQITTADTLQAANTLQPVGRYDAGGLQHLVRGLKHALQM